MKIRTISNFLYKFKIFKRIVPTLLKLMVKFFNIKEIKIIHNNLIFSLNPKNPIDREIYLKNKYEDDQITFLESYNLILFSALFLNKFASLIYLLTISVDL